VTKLVCAVAAGAVAAVVVPLTRPGVGWLIAAVAMVVSGFVAGFAAGPRRRPGAGRLLAGLGAVLLVAAGTLRAAGWLFVLCLAVAVPLGSLAVAGGAGTWRGTARGAVAVPAAVPRAVRGVRVTAPRRLLPGALAGAALTVVSAVLFARADAVFANLLRQAAGPLAPARLLVFAAVAALALGAAAARRTTPADEDPAAPRRLRRLDWAVPVAALDVLFVVFVGVQVTVLFAGKGYVLGHGGPDYAVYARGGFWQLTAVTLLTLAVVGVVAHRAARETVADRRLVRLLVGPLCLLALVVVASALRRMGLYVEAYGFPRVRLLAFGFEALLGAGFGLVLAAGVRLRAPWLPGAAVGTVVAAVLGLVALNPDGYIAHTVIDRYRHDGHLDAAYLSGLSADAVPEIDRLPAEYRTCVLAGLAERPSTVDTWYAANAGRHAAARILAARPVPRDAQPCPWIVYGPHDAGYP
jgi:hypothetical protein